MRSEAQKKADKKYKSANYGTLASYNRIQYVDFCKEYATKCGISISKMITNCINYCINNNIDISGSIKLNQSGADTISDIQDDISDIL